MWHDGPFTYLRSRAEESPALYELQEADRRFGRRVAEPALVSYELHDDGPYVADHVLGDGRLRIGDSETEWSLDRPKLRWTWKTRAVVGGILAAFGAVVVQGVTR